MKLSRKPLLTVQALESRITPALTASLDSLLGVGNVLTVNSDTADDSIDVAINGGVITVRRITGSGPNDFTPVSITDNTAGGTIIPTVAPVRVARIVVNGNDGIDTIRIGSTLNKPTILNGGDGDDFIFGGPGKDTISGGIGNDYIDGRAGDDSLSGGDNDDTIFGDNGRDSIQGGLGDDFLSGDDSFETFMGNDTIAGGDDQDFIFGGKGNDSLLGENGQDLIDGGIGNDILIGGNDDDLLYGGIGNDRLEGGDQNDYLFGEAGMDTLLGGMGADTLNGGLNRDVFIGDLVSFNSPHEADFDLYKDDIDLSKPVSGTYAVSDISMGAQSGLSPTLGVLASLVSTRFYNPAARIRYLGAGEYSINLDSGAQFVRFDGSWSDNEPMANAGERSLAAIVQTEQREFWPILFTRARLQQIAPSYDPFTAFRDPNIVGVTPTFAEAVGVGGMSPVQAMFDFAGYDQLGSAPYNFVGTVPPTGFGFTDIQSLLAVGAYITVTSANSPVLAGLAPQQTYALTRAYSMPVAGIVRQFVTLYNVSGFDRGAAGTSTLDQNGVIRNDGLITLDVTNFYNQNNFVQAQVA